MKPIREIITEAGLDAQIENRNQKGNHMTDTEKETIREVQRWCLDMDNRVVALCTLLTTKAAFTKAEFDSCLQVVRESRAEMRKAVEESDVPDLLGFLRGFEGTVQ